MSFNRLYNDIHNGLKRNIYSRKNKLNVTISRFSELSNIYFKDLSRNEDFVFKVRENNKTELISILRGYYTLWLTIDFNTIKIHKKFPETVILLQEVNKTNHKHVPKIFKKNTKMYLANNNYSICNYLKGIPLWDKMQNNIPSQTTTISCQINYPFLKPLFSKQER